MFSFYSWLLHYYGHQCYGKSERKMAVHRHSLTVRFVMEITKLQTRPDNMPVTDQSDIQTIPDNPETKKDQ